MKGGLYKQFNLKSSLRLIQMKGGLHKQFNLQAKEQFEINSDVGEDLTNSFIYTLKSSLRLIQM